jgi:membrane protease YdiL (CAAX protease family)
LVIALLLPLIPALGGALTGLSTFSLPPVGYVLPLLLVQLLTSGLGEEPGWRGYLLPRLQQRFGSGATWRLGLIWALWHYPITIVYALAPLNDTPMMAALVTVLVSLAGQTLSLIGMTTIYVWLFNQTGSVFLSIVFHALTNVFNTVIIEELPPSFAFVVAAMPWLVVFVLEQVLGKEQFPGKPSETVVR